MQTVNCKLNVTEVGEKTSVTLVLIIDLFSLGCISLS
jgi:hypothetical protein